MDILFFSRGRGRGHAIPDMALMDRIRTCDSSLTWKFVSYGTGAAAFSAFGHDVLDLQLPEENQFLETLLRTNAAIVEWSPRLVISHEEPAALVSATIHGLPSLYLTDWFLPDQYMSTQALALADAVLFLQAPGLFDEPSSLGHKVDYVGAFVRDLSYTRSDRSRARNELSLPAGSTVIAVLPGGWATEARAPIADLLLAAFDALDAPDKRLVWVAGSDRARLADLTRERLNVLILDQTWPIEQLMVASDVVITKGNRITILEVAALGIPSISLSHGLNHVEDAILPTIHTNVSLRVRGISPAYLANCIQTAVGTPHACDPAHLHLSSADTVAAALLKLIKLAVCAADTRSVAAS